MSTKVQCHCGAVQVEISGEPLVQLYCHCEDCQAAHGAAYVPISIYPAAAVNVTQGTLTWWTLKRTPRASCSACGTRIVNEPVGRGIRGVIGYLLPKGTFKPTLHIQCQGANLPVRDGLPHVKAFPAAFGGSDETVDW